MPGCTRRTPFQALRDTPVRLVSPISQVGLWPWVSWYLQSELVWQGCCHHTGVPGSSFSQNRNHTCLLYNWEVFCSSWDWGQAHFITRGLHDMLTHRIPLHQCWQVSSLIGSRGPFVSLLCRTYPAQGPVQVARQSVSWWCSRQLTALICCRMHTEQDWFMSTWATNLSSSKDLKANFRVHHLSELKWKRKDEPGLAFLRASITSVFLAVSWQEKDSSMTMDRILSESASASPSQTDFTTFGFRLQSHVNIVFDSEMDKLMMEKYRY